MGFFFVLEKKSRYDFLLDNETLHHWRFFFKFQIRNFWFAYIMETWYFWPWNVYKYGFSVPLSHFLESINCHIEYDLGQK